LFLRYDITMPWGELRDYFRSRAINTALHLAWQFNPPMTRAGTGRFDVEGSQNFLSGRWARV